MAIAVNWILYNTDSPTPVLNPDLPFQDLGAYLPSTSHDGITGIEKKFYIGLQFQGCSVYNIRVWMDGTEVDVYAPSTGTAPLALRAPISTYAAFYGVVGAPGGSGAAFSFTMSGGAVTALTLTNGGTGYIGSTASLTFTGGSPGTSATGTVNIVDGVVTSIASYTGGIGYGSSPTISVSQPTDPATEDITTWNAMPTDEGTGLVLGDALLGSSFSAYSAIFVIGAVAAASPDGPLGSPVDIELCNFRLLTSFSTTDE